MCLRRASLSAPCTPPISSQRHRNRRLSNVRRSASAMTRSHARQHMQGVWPLRGIEDPLRARLGRVYVRDNTRVTAARVRSSNGDAQLADDRVPVTVLTGFLGSGKTTLLNHVLRGDHGLRIAVIENEFGEEDIDSELVAMQEESVEEIVMLSNGCACCTVRGDLVRTLDDLLKRRSKFDHIIIETTGLADPGPVIGTFLLDPQLAAQLRLDGVVSLVDAKHIGIQLDRAPAEGEINEAVQQIAFADRLVLNKTDLVTPEEIKTAEERIRGINTVAEIRRSSQAAVDLDFVLGIGGFDLDRVEGLFDTGAEQSGTAHVHDHDGPEGTCSGCGEDHAHDHGHDHAHDHGHDHGHDHAHDQLVSSVSIVVDGEMDLDKVNQWLGLLLQYRGEDIYRTKGILAIKGVEEKFVYQGVHMYFDGSPWKLWGKDEPRRSRMVFIGRELEADIIREGFETCLAGADAEWFDEAAAPNAEGS
ncbi:unnamed protein product [Pedinophyceae sp. YPF-701]|nr:unnamed protein product [Pedinophyceae sp. YPF-701]